MSIFSQKSPIHSFFSHFQRIANFLTRYPARGQETRARFRFTVRRTGPPAGLCWAERPWRPRSQILSTGLEALLTGTEQRIIRHCHSFCQERPHIRSQSPRATASQICKHSPALPSDSQPRMCYANRASDAARQNRKRCYNLFMVG